MKRSAGLLLYRQGGGGSQVLLVHPGGPFWRRKDAGAWSIPKGEIGVDEDALAAALREFAEETGVTLDLASESGVLPLGEIRQTGGKQVTAWALQRDLDPAAIVSNTFETEWPPRSGRMQSFPEIDRAGWFDLPKAHEKILASQRPLLDRLEAMLNLG